MRKGAILAWILIVAAVRVGAIESPPPVRLAIIGLVHDHVGGMLPSLVGRTDVQLVGIVEADQKLCAFYAEKYHLDPKLFFTTFDALRAATQVQVVATFTSTFDHRKVVEMCAPLGIDVMMEKPFAVSMDDARAMAAAAAKGGSRSSSTMRPRGTAATRPPTTSCMEARGLGTSGRSWCVTGTRAPRSSAVRPISWHGSPTRC